MCGSSALTPALSLENAATTLRVGRRSSSADFVLCDASRDAFACGLLQRSAHERRAGPERAPSGAYRTVRAHLRCAATEALEIISGRDCAALDIGCNDGTLLSYYPRWVERVGVDANIKATPVGSWATTIEGAFPDTDVMRALGERKFDVVTAISVLERMADPTGFVSALKSILADDGVAVIETLYAPMALAGTQVEGLAAGGEAVYSLSVLERLARDGGLKIFRGALTDKEGGSIRLFLTHTDNHDYDFDPWFDRLARLWDEENALALRALQPYQAFEERARAGRAAFAQLLDDLAARGRKAYLLSTGPAAVALYRWAGAAAGVIEAAICEGATAPRARLCENGPAIICEGAARALEPDYLIAPAPLKREMLERWREPLMLGAAMIIAGPEPQLVDASNYSAVYGKALAGGDHAGGVETLRAILTAAGGPRLIAETSPGRAAAIG